MRLIGLSTVLGLLLTNTAIFAYETISVARYAKSISAQTQNGGRRRGVRPSSYGWNSSYRSAISRAKKSGKPIMVVIRCVP